MNSSCLCCDFHESLYPKQRFATPEDLWQSMGLSVDSRNDSMYSILNLEDYAEHPVLQHQQEQGLGSQVNKLTR